MVAARVRTYMEGAAVRARRGIFPSYRPRWAEELFREIRIIHRKVGVLMAIDTQVVARLVAGASALVEQNRLLVGERDALKETLGAERAAEALEDQTEAAASAEILAAADAVDALVKGPETPDIPAPPIGEVPPVVDGTVPVVDEGGSPVPSDGSTLR